MVWVAVTATFLVPTVKLHVNVWTPEDCSSKVSSLLAVILSVDVWLLELKFIFPSLRIYASAISVAGDQVTSSTCKGVSSRIQDITWSSRAITSVVDGVILAAENFYLSNRTWWWSRNIILYYDLEAFYQHSSIVRMKRNEIWCIHDHRYEKQDHWFVGSITNLTNDNLLIDRYYLDGRLWLSGLPIPEHW